MTITALLQAATAEQRFADNCDLRGFIGHPVNLDGEPRGTIIRAWIENGSLYAEIEVERSALWGFSTADPSWHPMTAARFEAVALEVETERS